MGSWRWAWASAGFWCLAGVAELVGQWRLLSPPFGSFFGQRVVAMVLALYVVAGLMIALPLRGIRSAPFRWFLLLAPPAVVGLAGLFYPAGGLRSVSGVLMGAGVMAASSAASYALRSRTPSPILVVPVALACAPLLAAGGRPSAPSSSPGEARTNVVLVTLDTLRPDHLGLAGYARNTSPGLDSLAATGVVFTQAYAPAPSTSPSHATILTGLSPSAHGVRRNGWPLGRDMTTLAEVFSHAGYATGAVVSVAHLGGGFGWRRGFSFFRDQGRMDGLFPYSGVRLIRLILHFVPLEFSCRAERSVDRALAWLDRVDEPFFLWLHLWDPHDPYEPPSPYDTLFTGEVAVPQGSGCSAAEISTWINGYDGEIRYMDDQLRRLWHFLRARGLVERTLVAVVSDHGESLGERSYRGHSILLYDEQVRVLVLLTGPGITPSSVDVPIGLIDVASTVLKATGLPEAMASEGRSVLQDSLQVRAVRFEVDMWGFQGRGVRVGQWKLATYDRTNLAHPGFATTPGPLGFVAGTELYDLMRDPGETTTRAREQPDLVDDLAHLSEPPRPSGVAIVPPATRRLLRALGYAE